jgi:hypothetical protein
MERSSTEGMVRDRLMSIREKGADASMPTRFCTNCWAAQPWSESICSQCGTPLIDPAHDGVPYREKLLRALQHPDPQTCARAAMLLGTVCEPHDAEAIAALLALLPARSRGSITGAPQSNTAGTHATSSEQAQLYDSGIQAEAIGALGRLEACETSSVLCQIAMQDEIPLLSGLRAVDTLAELAEHGCNDANDALQRLAREASRVAVRTEACAMLAALNEPE